MTLLFVILIITVVILGGMLCGIIIAFSDAKGFRSRILPKPLLFSDMDQFENSIKQRKYGLAH